MMPKNAFVLATIVGSCVLACGHDEVVETQSQTATLSGRLSTSAASPRYSGEELFRGLYFAEGRAAHLINRAGYVTNATAERYEGTTHAEERRSEPGANEIRRAASNLRHDGAPELIVRRLEAIAGRITTLPTASGPTARNPTSPQSRELAVERLQRQIAEKDPSFFGHFASVLYSGNRPHIREVLETGALVLADAATEASLDSLVGGSSLGCQVCGVNDGVMLFYNYSVNVDTAVNINRVYNIDTIKNMTNLYSKSAIDTGLRRDVIVDEIAAVLTDE